MSKTFFKKSKFIRKILFAIEKQDIKYIQNMDETSIKKYKL